MFKLHPYNRQIILLNRWRIPYAPAYGWLHKCAPFIGKLLPDGWGLTHVWLDQEDSASSVYGLTKDECKALGINFVNASWIYNHPSK